MSMRAVIRSLQEDGRDAMGPGVMVWRDHNVDIRNRSQLIVESNQKCIVRIQGQVTGVYDAGAQALNTPNSPISSFFARAGYGGNVPWLAEAIFFSLARFEAKSRGVSQSSELIPLAFEVAYYFQIVEPTKLLSAIQLNGLFYTVNDLSNYIAPIIDQAVSTILNNVSIVEVYKNLHLISEAVTAHLKQSLGEIGINLLMSRVIKIEPEDETLRRVVQLKGLGFERDTAVRARLSEIMAMRSDPAATNMYLGVPYYAVNILFGGGSMPQLVGQAPPPTSPPVQQLQQQQQQQPSRGNNNNNSQGQSSGGAQQGTV